MSRLSGAGAVAQLISDAPLSVKVRLCSAANLKLRNITIRLFHFYWHVVSNI
jgi:hypothetical protein